MAYMTAEKDNLLTQVEEILQEKYREGKGSKARVQSTAAPARGSARHDQLVLPLNERPKMPFTQDKYIVRENPHLVQWERTTREFLRQLSPDHGHRISAVMVYEWATGIRVVDKIAAGEAITGDAMKINKILRFYFGKPYQTYIMGRKVAKAYRVNPGYYIRLHRPMTLTLYAEYSEGVLYP
jgi:hypothetical protein